MIEITNTKAFGWDAAIRGMRNPMNSWDKSDSVFSEYYVCGAKVGENDLALMRKLVLAGSDHSKFMRMINVTADITAPLYWWKEFDTYKVGTVANSCSTMHTIADKKFTLDDFSHEHLGVHIPAEKNNGEACYQNLWDSMLENIVSALNIALSHYNYATDPALKKAYWWQIIQLLPSSYNQKRTVQLNYAVLRSMYHARRNHKLDEWRDFCSWVESLPYAELITLGGNDNGKD